MMHSASQVFGCEITRALVTLQFQFNFWLRPLQIRMRQFMLLCCYCTNTVYINTKQSYNFQSAIHLCTALIALSSLCIVPVFDLSMVVHLVVQFLKCLLHFYKQYLTALWPFFKHKKYSILNKVKLILKLINENNTFFQKYQQTRSKI